MLTATRQDEAALVSCFHRERLALAAPGQPGRHAAGLLARDPGHQVELESKDFLKLLHQDIKILSEQSCPFIPFWKHPQRGPPDSLVWGSTRGQRGGSRAPAMRRSAPHSPEHPGPKCLLQPQDGKSTGTVGKLSFAWVHKHTRLRLFTCEPLTRRGPEQGGHGVTDQGVEEATKSI